MRILAHYKNGNYQVTLFEDGTKVKRTDDEAFSADFPDSIDLKITDYCENNCPMCHENSSVSGRHGDLSHPVIDSFHAGMEVAIGGGNPLSHPGLLPFLERLKERGIVANITVNALDLGRQRERIESMISSGLIYGVGVSCLGYDEAALSFAIDHPNVVLHLINGVYPVEDFRRTFNRSIKVLILGYKEVGRGRAHFTPDVRQRMAETKAMLREILGGFRVVSFDNLALTQLDVAGAVGKERFDACFMGEDGEASMYIDLVREEYALSSASAARAPLSGTLRECFHRLPR